MTQIGLDSVVDERRTVMSPTATLSAPDVAPHLATTEVIFRKLLVAIDFGPQTSQVVKTAISVAKAFHAEMLLVHAACPVIIGTGTEPLPAESYAINLEAAQTRMADLVRGQSGLESIRHREFVEYGAPLEMVQQKIRDEKIDLVIAGSHGARGLERLALGSIAEAMLRHLNCPVLVVGPYAKRSISPFRSVLLASSLKIGGLRAAQYASALAEKFHGKLTLLHVIEEEREDDGMEAERVEDHARKELMRLLPPDVNAYSKTQVRLAYGEPAHAIRLIAREAYASVIVCGVEEGATLADHSLGSTLAQVIRESCCPVLCVRAHSG